MSKNPRRPAMRDRSVIIRLRAKTDSSPDEAMDAVQSHFAGLMRTVEFESSADDIEVDIEVDSTAVRPEWEPSPETHPAQDEIQTELQEFLAEIIPAETNVTRFTEGKQGFRMLKTLKDEGWRIALRSLVSFMTGQDS